MNESDYPSLDLAYPVALEAYDWTVKRYDAIEAKIQAIVGIGVTASLAVPVAFTALKVQTDPIFLVAALVFFVLAVGVGSYARMFGAIIMITPTILHEKWLEMPTAEFKANMIYFSGEHFDKNVALIGEKHKLLVIAILLFCLEAACLGISCILPHLGQT